MTRELVALVRDRDRAGRRLQGCPRGRRLPKTRIGKILRGTMRKIADGEPWRSPPTIDDPAILEEIGAWWGRG